MTRYSDSWNFMFIQLFVQELFHFSIKLKILTILKRHAIFDHVQKKIQKKDASKIMPHSDFLFTVMVIAIMLIYKELFKNTKISKILLGTCFFKLLIFH